MNRRKSAASLGFPSLVLLAIAVVIVSSGGIGYVVMKNKQITTRSQISVIQKQMDKHDVSIKFHRTKINEMLGYRHLPERLIEINSPLTAIEFVEVYRDSDEQTPTPADDSMARR